MTMSAITSGVSASLESQLRSLDNLGQLRKQLDTSGIGEQAAAIADIGEAGKDLISGVTNAVGQFLNVKA